MLKHFHPITHKKDAPEDKDPPEGKELSNLSWPYLSKAILLLCTARVFHTVRVWYIPYAYTHTV